MPPRKILVVRNDKLGDFMLAYPSFALLKGQLPQARICALVPAYTREMAQACPWIDEVLVDPGQASGLRGLAALLRGSRFDAALVLFSTTRTALACLLAGIPYRLAPATKLAQFLYNRREVQRRSRSEKPEYAYNLDLARRLLADFGVAAGPDPQPPFLQFPAAETAALRSALCAAHGLATESRLVFIHPGSGGSAGNLSLDQYASLARALRSDRPIAVVVSAGPGEEAMAAELGALLGGLPHGIFRSTGGLLDFARHLQCADLFVSGSTGPLHIAGALDRPTAAFYPRRRSATPLRWQTLNSPERRLAFTPPDDADEHDMSSIDVATAATLISARFL